MSERFLTGTPKSLRYDFGPQGETRQLTDSAGARVDSYLYTAYGEPVASSGTDRNPFQYGGQVGYYTGLGAGIVLCGARWYNPYTARWMTRDPIGYAGGADLYAYCGESPVVAADPSGLLYYPPKWMLLLAQGWNGLTGIFHPDVDRTVDMGRAPTRIVREMPPPKRSAGWVWRALGDAEGGEPLPAGGPPYDPWFGGSTAAPPYGDVTPPTTGPPGGFFARNVWTERSPGSGGGLAAPGIILEGAGVLAAGLDAIIPYRLRIEQALRDIDEDNPGPYRPIARRFFGDACSN